MNDTETWLALALAALVVFGLILAPFLYAAGAALYWLINRITPLFLALYVLWFGAELYAVHFRTGSSWWIDAFVLLSASWLGLGVAVSAAGALTYIGNRFGLALK